jgi:hypothetical protein
MRRNVLLASCLAFALGTAGCQEQKTAPTAPDAELRSESTTALRFNLEQARLKLPSSVRISDQYFADVVRRAIDPTEHVCDPLTPLVSWLFGEIDEIPPAILNGIIFPLAADQIPFVDALFFQTEDTPQFFGYNGEYTKIMLKTERDVKRFWDIFSDDIQLIGMHGTMLLDVDRVAASYEAGFVDENGDPISHDDAVLFATLVANAVQQTPALKGGNHALFSFNAFAISAPGFIPDKVVMGDGILEGYEALGFGDVAPQGVYGHEFAHHIQYENGYFDEIPPGATTVAELTRYTELMADAMSAYYLTHKRGGAMNRKRVEQFLQAFFQIGDCSFTSSGHHGTPNQRMRAARFGFDLADQAQKQGHILTSDQVHDAFVAAYPSLVAPDAT